MHPRMLRRHTEEQRNRKNSFVSISVRGYISLASSWPRWFLLMMIYALFGILLVERVVFWNSPIRKFGRTLLVFDLLLKSRRVYLLKLCSSLLCFLRSISASSLALCPLKYLWNAIPVSSEDFLSTPDRGSCCRVSMHWMSFPTVSHVTLGQSVGNFSRVEDQRSTLHGRFRVWVVGAWETLHLEVIIC
jgi:hypothetical protein